MARINIEDSIWKDSRFIDLAVKLGGKRLALGALVEAWILAQQHYLTVVNDRLIPLSEWKHQKIADELIEVGLAEIREKGVYISGSDEQFQWLIQRSDAGKKSAQIKREKKDSTTVSGSQPPPLPLINKQHHHDDEKLFKFKEALAGMFNGIIPTSIQSKIPNMIYNCQNDIEAALTILTDIWQNPKINEGTGLKGDRSAYLATVLKDRFALEDSK